MAFRHSERRGPPKDVLSAEGTIGSFDVLGGQTETTRGARPRIQRVSCRTFSTCIGPSLLVTRYNHLMGRPAWAGVCQDRMARKYAMSISIYTSVTNPSFVMDPGSEYRDWRGMIKSRTGSPCRAFWFLEGPCIINKCGRAEPQLT